MKKYKVLFTDLDGTLINTISGEPFPKGIWDMKLRFDVLDKIKELNPQFVFIVSNQGGIELGFVNHWKFTSKIVYIQNCIREYTKIEQVYFRYCPSNDINRADRKPNIGMLTDLSAHASNKLIYKPNMLMIGDFETDRKTAENFGIDYLDVEDFIKSDIEV